MKIVFAGTPEYAVKPLEALLSTGCVAAVITQEDKPVGRKNILTPPPVKVCAEKFGVPVYQFAKIREHVQEIVAIGADCMVTCAYGQLLTADILDAFPLGVFNLHASLLPKFRGASPIQSAVLAGESVTGVTVMKTALGMDTGDILFAEETPILPNETAGELAERLSVLSAKAALRLIETLATGNFTLTPQDNALATKVRKIQKENALLDFSKPVRELVRTVLGMNPSPVAYTYLRGQVLNVYRAEEADYTEEQPSEVGTVVCALPKKGVVVRCQDGYIRLTELQAFGGKRMRDTDFANGKKVAQGEKLGE